MVSGYWIKNIVKMTAVINVHVIFDEIVFSFSRDVSCYEFV